MPIHPSQLDIDRKPHPYGDCTQEYEHDLRDVYAEIYPVEYSNMASRMKIIWSILLYTL